MAYTVKEVAKLSGVSVRTLHFYDETGLLKPAFVAANGYRFYDEPQLLILQQILFYRELGFELKTIREVLSRDDFEKIAALQSHRVLLEENLARTAKLIETIGKTIDHLTGETIMKSEELFVGFSVAAGADRFAEGVHLRGEPADCKVSAKDTEGAMCVFEFTGRSGGPLHSHREENEWIYIVDGELDFQVGERRFRAVAGESVYIPRGVAHAWAGAEELPSKIVNVYQPAGKMEEFFRALGKFNDGPPVHEALSRDEFRAFFADHGMVLLGPPLGWDE